MRILVIEDNTQIRNIVVKALKELSYAVDQAEDGEEGLRLAIINNYTLIVLDDKLPKKSGLAVCHELRDRGRNMRILVLTANSEIKNKVAFLDSCKADEYITKPFSLEELNARVRAVLRRPRNIQSDIFKCGDLVLREPEYEVTKAGEEIGLTRKEYAVLKYLMMHPNLMVSQSMIFEHCWDEHADVFSNTVEAHIGSLRKKIGDEEKTLIKTIPARGYKLICPKEE